MRLWRRPQCAAATRPRRPRKKLEASRNAKRRGHPITYARSSGVVGVPAERQRRAEVAVRTQRFGAEPPDGPPPPVERGPACPGLVQPARRRPHGEGAGRLRKRSPWERGPEPLLRHSGESRNPGAADHPRAPTARWRDDTPARRPHPHPLRRPLRNSHKPDPTPSPWGEGGGEGEDSLAPPKAPMAQRNLGGRTLPHPHPLPRGEGTGGMRSLSHSQPEPGQSPSVDGVSSTNQRPSQERPMAKVTASSCEPPSRTAPVR